MSSEAVVLIVVVVVTALARVLVVALLRPTGPVTINAQGAVINVSMVAPLPQSSARPNLPAMSESERAAYRPGDLVQVDGIYWPNGKLCERSRAQPVAVGHLVVHETHFEVGDVFPELTGYDAGAVWVRERAR